LPAFGVFGKQGMINVFTIKELVQKKWWMTRRFSHGVGCVLNQRA
jgi:hypothetical protein